MSLHLRRLPPANILQFPNSAIENRAATVAQFENIFTALVTGNGTFLARQMFSEAAAAVIVREARKANCLDDARTSLLQDFDYELGTTAQVTA